MMRFEMTDKLDEDVARGDERCQMDVRTEADIPSTSTSAMKDQTIGASLDMKFPTTTQKHSQQRKRSDSQPPEQQQQQQQQHQPVGRAIRVGRRVIKFSECDPEKVESRSVDRKSESQRFKECAMNLGTKMDTMRKRSNSAVPIIETGAPSTKEIGSECSIRDYSQAAVKLAECMLDRDIRERERPRYTKPLWYHMETTVDLAFLRGHIDPKRKIVTPKNATDILNEVYDIMLGPEMIESLKASINQMNVKLVCALLSGIKRIEITTSDIFQMSDKESDPYIARSDKCYIPAAMSLMAAYCVASSWIVEPFPEGNGDRFFINMERSVEGLKVPTVISIGNKLAQDLSSSLDIRQKNH